MDNQTPVPETPSSQVYTTPYIDNPPPPKSFLSSRILLLIVTLLILFGAGGTYLALNSKPKLQPESSQSKQNTPNQSDDWVKYEAKLAKVSLSLPKSWSVSEKAGKVKNNVEVGDSIIAKDVQNKRTLVIIKNLDEEYNSEYGVLNKRNIGDKYFEMLGGRNIGLYYDGDSQAILSLRVDKRGSNYFFRAYWNNKDKDAEKIIAEILKTVEIDPCSKPVSFNNTTEEITDWLEFIDTYSCFTLKHPKSWSYHQPTSALSIAAFIENYDLNKAGGGEWDPVKDKGKLKIQITPQVTDTYYHPSKYGEGIRVKNIDHYMELCCSEEGYNKLTVEGGKGYLAKKSATAVIERNGQEFHIGGLGFTEDSDKRLFDLTVSTFQFLNSSPTPTETQVACTQEAKICPDGSSVGRQGPNCEFAACPN